MPADLATVVAEIERHHAEAGWDQPPRLFALVNTGELVANEPQLAQALAGSDPDGLTPVEQEPVTEEVEELLARIAWPPLVLGCAFVNEILMLPDGAAEARPEGTDEVAWAEAHPETREVRLAVGVLRTGERAATVRVRGRDGEDDELLSAPDLVPNLATALLATFDTENEA
ncbi:MAG TPA: PPA1309 family protein [Mycobacteriales bacterium]|jgi:hypothetical protein|nr:PPA1309 family protein [Mycobacteriales bacterium]